MIKKIQALKPAFRWAIVGLVFSMVGNQAFEGSMIPSIIAVSLPAWVLAFRSTFSVVSDFFSPAAAWVVEKVGAFKALATTEGLEGVLCLIVALIPSSLPWWKWALFALSCALLLTGLIIDVAGEVFDVDMAGGDDKALVNYSAVLSVLASIVILLGSVAGSAIATVSVVAVLIFSSVTSFACAATRFFSRGYMPHHHTEEVLADSSPETSSADSSAENAEASQETESAVNTEPAFTIGAFLKKPFSSQNLPFASLLAGSFFLVLIPAFWISYTSLGIGHTHGNKILPVITAFDGAGSILGSLLYSHFSSKWTMKKLTYSGLGIMMAGVLLVATHFLPLICLGYMLSEVGRMSMAQSVVVARQLTFKGPALARFSGFVRFIASFAGVIGSWLGLLLSAWWQYLPFGALALGLLAVPALRALPEGRRQKSAANN